MVCLSLWLHKKLVVKFNGNSFLRNYHLCELWWFPDIRNFEYDIQVFKKLIIFITKNACMSMDYSYEDTFIDEFDDYSDNGLPNGVTYNQVDVDIDYESPTYKTG